MPTVPALLCAIGDRRVWRLRSQIIGKSFQGGIHWASCTWCAHTRGRALPTRGSACRAEANGTLRVSCAQCGKSIPTEIGHAHPLDESIPRDAWGLVGYDAGRARIFSTCATCHDLRWRPPDSVWAN